MTSQKHRWLCGVCWADNNPDVNICYRCKTEFEPQ